MGATVFVPQAPHLSLRDGPLRGPSIDALEADVEASPGTQFRAFRLNQWQDPAGKESWLGPKALDCVGLAG